MGKEYIEREAVLRHKRKMSSADFGGEFWDEAVLCEEIWKIPKADVAEVKHGRWEDRTIEEVSLNGLFYKCSLCGKATRYDLWNYCPNCGAKMGGERHD